MQNISNDLICILYFLHRIATISLAEHRSPESITGTPMSGSLTTASEEERRINEVLRQMWRYIHTYTMRFVEKVSKISKDFTL